MNDHVCIIKGDFVIGHERTAPASAAHSVKLEMSAFRQRFCGTGLEDRL